MIKYNSVIDFLESVDGLDYAEAIGRMAGNFENYMKVLNVSVGNIYENYNGLVSLADLSNMGQTANYFHGLKGIFLNIGAVNLAEQSKQLELAAKSFDTAYVKGHMREYMKQVKAFAGKLSDVCSIYKKQSDVSCGTHMDNEELNRNLEKMRKLIEEYDYTEITDLLEKIIPRCEGENRQRIQKIYDLIQNFEYEYAMSVLNEML